jgi:hypothetical protein
MYQKHVVVVDLPIVVYWADDYLSLNARQDNCCLSELRIRQMALQVPGTQKPTGFLPFPMRGTRWLWQSTAHCWSVTYYVNYPAVGGIHSRRIITRFIRCCLCKVQKTEYQWSHLPTTYISNWNWQFVDVIVSWKITVADVTNSLELFLLEKPIIARVRSPKVRGCVHWRPATVSWYQIN